MSDCERLNGLWEGIPGSPKHSEEAVGKAQRTENAIGSSRQGFMCHVIVESLATLTSAVAWKIATEPHELYDLAKEISRQNI